MSNRSKNIIFYLSLILIVISTLLIFLDHRGFLNIIADDVVLLLSYVLIVILIFLVITGIIKFNTQDALDEDKPSKINNRVSSKAKTNLQPSSNAVLTKSRKPAITARAKNKKSIDMVRK